MANAYTRQENANIVTGAIIQDTHLDNEFDAVEAAFDASAGHDHTGGVGLGPKIILTTGVTGTLPVANGGTNATTAAAAATSLGLGTGSTVEFTKLGVGGTLTDGTMHVLTATAGAVTAITAADDLVVESGDNGGISILGPDNKRVQIMFGSPGDSTGALVRWEYDSDLLTVGTAKVGASLRFFTGDVTEAARFDSNGTLFIGDTVNSKMTVGLTINQGANDNEILALKSSDVAHPITDFAETDTYGVLRKSESVAGGLFVLGYKDSGGAASGALSLRGRLGETAETTDTTSSLGVISLTSQITDGGTGVTLIADAGNILSIANSGTTRLLIKGNGTLHLTGDIDTLGSDPINFVNGPVNIGDTDVNANMTVGLTINQGANDDEILALKSSDVAHAMTGLTETDTYGTLTKGKNTSGGLNVTGYKDADGDAGLALILTGRLGETVDTTDTTNSNATVHIRGQITDGGTGVTPIADAGNLLVVENETTVRLLVKGNGVLHATNVTSGDGDLDGVALDNEDDVSLVRVFERTVHNGMGIAMSKWDEAVKGNEDDLKRLGVLSSQGDFYNMQRMNSLLGGAIWQLHTRLMEMQERVELTERQLTLLN